MSEWEPGEVRVLPIETLGERYRRYRLPDADAEAAMARSLSRYGQMAPVVVCLREETPEVIDGFKRLVAARVVPATKVLSARLLAADERAAKAAIYGLNAAGRHTRELEEAWIVSALVREDGLSGPEAAELLGRHKSWVCRRLALVERLVEEAREELRVGLLTPAAARALLRLHACNQVEGAGLCPSRKAEHDGTARRGRVAAWGSRPAADGVRAGEAARGAGPGTGRRRPCSRPAAECRGQPAVTAAQRVARAADANGELVTAARPGRSDGLRRRAAGRAVRPAER